jgi:flagellar P-ring protein precursor FlgI
VALTPVSVTHGDLKINVTAERSASQPLVLGGRADGVRSLEIANSRLEVTESEQTRHLPPGSTMVSDLVQALVRLKVTTRDIIAVLQSVKAAGALHADIVVQ